MESSINRVFAKYTHLSFERVKIINGIFRLITIARTATCTFALSRVFFLSSQYFLHCVYGV